MITSGNNIQLYYNFTLNFSSCQISQRHLYSFRTAQKRLAPNIMRNKYVFCRFHSTLCSFQCTFEKTLKFFRLRSNFRTCRRVKPQGQRIYTLHLSNSRFWSKSQGVHTYFLGSNWKHFMTKMHVRYYCRTCCVISCYDKIWGDDGQTVTAPFGYKL